MGCDIHTVVEVKSPDGWKAVPLDPPIFDWRSYRVFGFLADVRNYSLSPSIAPGRGFPDDLSAEAKELRENWDCDGHSATFVTLAELLAFDYSQQMENRRTTRTVANYTDGAALAEPGEGVKSTVREFLDGAFFKELDRLSALGHPADVRVLMLFDN